MSLREREVSVACHVLLQRIPCLSVTAQQQHSASHARLGLGTSKVSLKPVERSHDSAGNESSLKY